MARIDYQTLLDNALKSVVKDALVHAQFNGLGDGTHFFITFRTRDAGVVLPDFLNQWPAWQRTRQWGNPWLWRPVQRSGSHAGSSR